jgi:hypothetical protein
MFSENKKTGYIYKISCNTTNKCYIGSTTKPITTRLTEHKSNYKRYLNKQGNYTTSYDVLSNNNYHIEEVERVDFFNERELHERERNHIQTTNNIVNKMIPTRTPEEYYQDNRDKIIKRQTEYNKQHKDYISEQKKSYYIKNKERLRNYQIEYNKKKHLGNN